MSLTICNNLQPVLKIYTGSDFMIILYDYKFNQIMSQCLSIPVLARHNNNIKRVVTNLEWDLISL